MHNILPIGVLVSGSGTNLQSLIDACQKKQIQAEIKVVISNKPDVLALQRAKNANIPAFVVEYPTQTDRNLIEKNITQILKNHGVTLVVLAGFMKVLGKTFLEKFPGRVINIHPSLLPVFPGMNAQKQAFEAGVKESGATVHFVDEGCDTGPIILQEKVPILKTDTLEDLRLRILEKEHIILPKAVDLLAKNKVKLINHKVHWEES
ncbi:MAG: phosphoribosylglycinamide formyltransferase [Deltaproteobacteria bacterium RIFCSPLOWO2_12_FULL_40_28]|nr:MAG: phosphoribosylglycinamide formyltransferase [Deltaproteobacteria bacterium RIFCSPHIGHO2_02_FULL_40_28]OGQ18869.1 MAG: phosphoribosylglycinamide formyltransferase [Deltaproteobacteria bacterium RIFCSPHIGHO2_12_FULL_40_32]OGQ40114.1 MAG: phosphoribosylglycinamide formyltransferase [Deltaproteobacteria bacterium RIFCSPLOWO2_02_FULL_40_36]OGQ53297.1 MAG: phosphoribosylglycinamide formyltransferase [Deltaproteobacteria bacterium RIFCSPLOWO2_12_FULL_40_28]